MGKMIGAAEFKAHCLRILDEVQRTGESVTVTKRGKPVAEVKAVVEKKGRLTFGCLKHPEYRFDDPDSPVYEQPWNAELGILGDED
jgi:prevent-host-death family protein